VQQDDHVGKVAGDAGSEAATLTGAGIRTNQEHVDWALEVLWGRDDVSVGVTQCGCIRADLAVEVYRRIPNNHEGGGNENG